MCIRDSLKSAKGGVYALGNFDGVHLGHKEIISNVIKISRSKKIPSGVLIFDPHPRNYFNPKLDDFILSDIKTRSYLLEKTKLDFLGILKFDEAMSNLSPREFIEKVIKDRVGVSHLIVGYNFRFGKNREGDVEILSKICSEYNIDLTIIEQVKNKELIISSSEIRKAIEELDFKRINKIIRHIAKSVVLKKSVYNKPNKKQIELMLGAPKFDRNHDVNNDVVGVVTGLAWTSVGGDILFIESIISFALSCVA